MQLVFEPDFQCRRYRSVYPTRLWRCRLSCMGPVLFGIIVQLASKTTFLASTTVIAGCCCRHVLSSSHPLLASAPVLHIS